MNSDQPLSSLQPGTLLAGKYEVVKCLGAGSMGLVYACKNQELDGLLVAVKVLFPEVAKDKTAAARFRNEVFASYGVSHPNVVRAYEYLRDGDLIAYTMEYVGGGDLASRLSDPDPKISIGEILEMLRQMCKGVQAIHDAGIVHRDLKPENILLTREGKVKIADFGIARTGHGPKLTEHGGVVGTIDYVSPEYMLNSQVDWRSDIYALGILAYEMTTGEPPFRGDSVYATMTLRLKTDPKVPSTLRPECPPDLDFIILKAMARDPEKRYQSALEMFEDLDRVAHGERLQQDLSSLKEAPQALVERPTDSLSTSLTPLPRLRGSSSVQVDGEDSELAREEPEERHDKLAEVLRPNGVSPQWESSPRGSGSKGSSASPVPPRISYDSNRMARLSSMVETVHRSVWIDLFTWIAAVLIGVGVGYVFLKGVVPEILPTDPGAGSPVILQETIE